jgi:hypothetical protein
VADPRAWATHDNRVCLATRMQALEAAGAVVCWAGWCHDTGYVVLPLLYTLRAHYGVRSLLVEGGALTLSRFLEVPAAVDAVIVLQAPCLLVTGLCLASILPVVAAHCSAWAVGAMGVHALTFTLAVPCPPASLFSTLDINKPMP